MSKTVGSGRVALNEEAVAALARMTDELQKKESCIRLTPSSLVSWIVSEYERSGFQQAIEAIVRAHFNTKEYLKQALREVQSNDDLAQALKSVLDKVNSDGKGSSVRRRKRSPRMQQSDAVTSKSENESV